jgi:copine 5/8/9
MSVGEIVAPYDSDNKFPVYGFGAKIPGSTRAVSHCFPLTYNTVDAEVFGVQGILNAYHTSLQTLTLYGPTNFAPTIQAAASRAQEFFQQKQDVQAYLILLIITDGEITDMDDTVLEIVSASFLPLSIIIIGVGSADFTNMNILDGDNGSLKFRGRSAQRDIVQFVPFRDYKGKPLAQLAADTLAEVPGQFMAFMRANNILPRPPPSPQELAALQARRDQTMTQLAALPQAYSAPPPQQ